MANCSTSKNNPGKNVAVEFATGCGDDVFLSKTYKPLGTINAKDLTFAAVEADNTNDQSGSTTSGIVVRTSFDITVAGFLADDSATSFQKELILYYFAELKAGRQPTVWIRISGPNYPYTWHIFMNYKGGGQGLGTADVQSGSFDFSVTDTGTTINDSVNVT